MGIRMMILNMLRKINNIVHFTSLLHCISQTIHFGQQLGKLALKNMLPAKGNFSLCVHLAV